MEPQLSREVGGLVVRVDPGPDPWPTLASPVSSQASSPPRAPLQVEVDRLTRLSLEESFTLTPQARSGLGKVSDQPSDVQFRNREPVGVKCPAGKQWGLGTIIFIVKSIGTCQCYNHFIAGETEAHGG